MARKDFDLITEWVEPDSQSWTLAVVMVAF